MADILEDTQIYPALAELVECLRDSLGDSAPCFCDILMGQQIPVDYVGDCEDAQGNASCGAAYVRVEGAYPTADFPEPLAFPTSNSVMAYNVSVGVLRCASIGQDDGNAIDPADLKVLTTQLLSDMKSIRRAIQCCFMLKFPDVQHVMGVFLPIPQAGDVVGGEWPISILEDF